MCSGCDTVLSADPGWFSVFFVLVYYRREYPLPRRRDWSYSMSQRWGDGPLRITCATRASIRVSLNDSGQLFASAAEILHYGTFTLHSMRFSRAAFNIFFRARYWRRTSSGDCFTSSGWSLLGEWADPSCRWLIAGLTFSFLKECSHRCIPSMHSRNYEI